MTSASKYASHFSVQNIPFGIASSAAHTRPQAVTRLENTVVFLSDLAAVGLFDHIGNLSPAVLNGPNLNAFASDLTETHRAVRQVIQSIYQEYALDGFPAMSRVNIEHVTMHLPVEIRDFTDSSCSLPHVKNAGRIITKNDRVPPNFSHFPLAYQGRASSIVCSGTQIGRPWGYYPVPSTSAEGESTGQPQIVHAPSAKVDYELELAAVIGKPLGMRQRLTTSQAEEHIFGYVLLNDWSARDIQGFEMMPLGPFNGKSLGTSISPWIITSDALAPFKVPAPQSAVPRSSPLHAPNPVTYAITLEVEILSGDVPTHLGKCQIQSLYWTPHQMVAHATASGSPLRAGDLIATGTVSGDGPGHHGCLLESTEGGASPVLLADGTRRTYLEHGDVVRISGFAGEPDSGVGFGECVGELVGAQPCGLEPQ